MSSAKHSTATARKWIAVYNTFKECVGREPTTICVYECSTAYGGPQEGGWYYETGWPLKTICVFSKKQAIREAIRAEAETEEQLGNRKDYLGWNAWCVNFDVEYAKPYPEERPYYC
jgi:hypothetical protein